MRIEIHRHEEVLRKAVRDEQGDYNERTETKSQKYKNIFIFCRDGFVRKEESGSSLCLERAGGAIPGLRSYLLRFIATRTEGNESTMK